MAGSLDFLNILGLEPVAGECFQGVTGTVSGAEAGTPGTSTAAIDLGDLPELFKQAFLYEDAGTLRSILQRALCYTDADDPVVNSILEKALLYIKNVDGKAILESVLNDRLTELAMVDAILDFGFMRVHLKGRLIEY